MSGKRTCKFHDFGSQIFKHSCHVHCCSCADAHVIPCRLPHIAMDPTNRKLGALQDLVERIISYLEKREHTWSPARALRVVKVTFLSSAMEVFAPNCEVPGSIAEGSL